MEWFAFLGGTARAGADVRYLWPIQLLLLVPWCKFDHYSQGDCNEENQAIPLGRHIDTCCNFRMRWNANQRQRPAAI